MNPPPQPSPPCARHSRHWRRLALVILLLGAGIASWVWWQGRAAAALQDDPTMLIFNRKNHQQMGMFFGKSGYLMDDLFDALKQPGTQAVLILATAIVLAGGCFLISRLPESAPNPDFFKPSRPAGDGRDGQ